MFSVLYGKCLPPPRWQFRPDEEDGVIEVKFVIYEGDTN